MQVESVERAKAGEEFAVGKSQQNPARTEDVESQEVAATGKSDLPQKFQDVASEQQPLAPIQEMFALATSWEKIILLIGNIGAFGNGVIQPGLFLIFGDMIDAIAEDRADIMEPLEEACLKMTITGVLDLLLASMQMFGFKYFAEKQAFRFRALYVESVLHQDIAWFDARSVAALPSQMSLDAEKIGEAFGDKLGISCMSWWSIVGGIACAVIAGWHIGLVCLIVGPFLAFGALHMARAGQEIQSDTQLWYKKAAVVVEECLYALRTVIAFGGEKKELAHFEYAIEKARKGGVRGGLKIGLSFGFTCMCMYLTYAASMWYGGELIYHGVDHPTRGGDYTPGAVLGCLFSVLVAAFSVGSFPPGVAAFQSGRAAMARFHDAQKCPTAIERRGKDERLVCPAAIESFELSNVHFSYPSRPDVPVLRGLSLRIEKGQKVAVVGESGSGKSTLMALLERFYDPHTGVVMLNGTDMKTFAVKTLRRSIGYVGQEPVLFATTVKANILQGSQYLLREEDMDAELDRVIGEAELSFIKELPEGLNTYVGNGGCQFSGGQKQRIVIARALIKNTSVLFFDEATSALDTKSEKMIQHTIDRIGAQATGKNRVMTMVSIAHRLSTIRHCDIIHVMSRGETVENGTHAELLEMRGSYYALVAAQQVAEAKQAEEAEEGAEERDELEKEELSEAVIPASQAAAVDVAASSGVNNAANEQEKGNEKQNENENEKKQEDDPKKGKDGDDKQEVAKKEKVPMRRVLAFCKPEWPLMIPAVFGAIVDGSAMPVSSVLLAEGLAALSDKDKGEIREIMTFIASLLVGLALADLLACVTQHSCLAMVGEGMVKRLRVALLQHLFRQEVGFHDDPAHSPAILGEALELWTYRMSNLVKAWGAKSGAFTSVFIGMTIAFIYSWEMAVGLILAVPLMVGASLIQFLLLFGTTSADSAGQQAQQVLSDAVQNARVCHACVSEDAIVSLYVSLLGKTTKGLVKRCGVAAFGFGLSFGLTIWILAAGFYYAGKLATEGDKEFIDVTAAFLGVFFSAMGAGQCAATLGDADKANTAAQEMFKILDRKSEIDSLDPQGEIPTFANAMDAGSISFEAVKFRYPFRADVEVLKGMSFSVVQGQAAGLVGPSGGGKSTVMALIQRFYDPEAGSVQIGPLGQQVELSSLNIRWWRRQLGFVGQEPILFDTTVKANLLYGFSDGEEEMPSNDWMEQCAQMANLCFLDQEPKRLETEVGPRGSRLSGGQKQRVAICRALIRNPPVLLFDEATSALDSQSEQVVQRALEAVREGRTSFSVAHRLSTIAGCDVILVVSSGVIVEQGSHQDLIDAGGVYSKLAKASGGTARQS